MSRAAPRLNNKGFTLVELLVVISIIAILATIGMAVYSSVQKGTRDAKRKADLTAISRALEQYKAVNGKYPDMVAWSNQQTTSWADFSTAIRPYMAQTPIDPKNGGGPDVTEWYVYGYIPDGGITFRLCANLENNNDSARNVDYPTVPTTNPPREDCSRPYNTGKWGDFQVVSQQ